MNERIQGSVRIASQVRDDPFLTKALREERVLTYCLCDCDYALPQTQREVEFAIGNGHFRALEQYACCEGIVASAFDQIQGSVNQASRKLVVSLRVVIRREGAQHAGLYFGVVRFGRTREHMLCL